MRVKVKICGITCMDDAQAAGEAGADALGFVFYRKSRRYISPEDAGTIIRRLPPFIITVGLFVDENVAAVRTAAEAAGVDILQFHGQETPDYCRSFDRRIIKAFRLGGGASADMDAYQAAAFLLDTYHPGLKGGTGTSFDWSLAVKAGKGRQNQRIVLAGGLTPENVARAVKQVCPYGVDVSSGVEESPGKKDHEKMQEFIRRAKEAGRKSI